MYSISLILSVGTLSPRLVFDNEGGKWGERWRIVEAGPPGLLNAGTLELPPSLLSFAMASQTGSTWNPGIDSLLSSLQLCSKMDVVCLRLLGRALEIGAFLQGEEGSRPGQRWKLSCDAISMERSDNSVGCSEARILLQNCPTLRKGGWAFMSPQWSVFRCGPPLERRGFLVLQAVPEASGQQAWMPAGLLGTKGEHFVPKGPWAAHHSPAPQESGWHRGSSL